MQLSGFAKQQLKVSDAQNRVLIRDWQAEHPAPDAPYLGPADDPGMMPNTVAAKKMASAASSAAEDSKVGGKWERSHASAYCWCPEPKEECIFPGRQGEFRPSQVPFSDKQMEVIWL